MVMKVLTQEIYLANNRLDALVLCGSKEGCIECVDRKALQPCPLLFNLASLILRLVSS